MLMQTEVKQVAESTPGRRDDEGSERNYMFSVLRQPYQSRRTMRKLGFEEPLTLGTTSLNQGVGDRSSENQLAVADPLSLARL